MKKRLNLIFPVCTLAITWPISDSIVSDTGFIVKWEGHECGGSVVITIMKDNDSTGIFKIVDNDGAETLTAADLVPLGGQTGSYNLIIYKQVQ